MSDRIIALDFERPIIELEAKISEIRSLNQAHQNVDLDEEIKSLEEKRDGLMREIFSSLTSWQRVQLARHPKRPHTSDYIAALFTDFIELHGDRNFADDPAVVTGIGFFEAFPVVVIGTRKGRTVEESMHRNFGMMHPEGYRKALRVMKLAEKFSRPVITFIDTPGAYPGIEAEERGQAEAIARNLREMSALKVPIISVVIGEGGSGGALGIGIADHILMLENAWYSVISPEGCAAILFRDATKAPDAARALKLTAQELLGLKVIDEIIPEPLGGAHRDFKQVVTELKGTISRNLQKLQSTPIPELLDNRYKKYRRMGVWSEQALQSVTAEAKEPAKKARTKSKEKLKKI